MGTRNRFSVARPCCGQAPPCTYQASDGNVWSDPFDSLDPGWIVRWAFFDTFIANGRLLCSTMGTPPNTSSDLYRTIGIVPTGLNVIAESNVYHQQYSATTGVTLWLPIGARQFSIFARWAYGNIGAYAFGSFRVISSAIASGDKLTVQVKHVTGSDFRACYYCNGVQVYTEQQVWVPTGTLEYGVTCTPGGGTTWPKIIGEWDNYSCHVGNP